MLYLPRVFWLLWHWFFFSITPILPGAEHVQNHTGAAEQHAAFGPGCAALSSSANCASLWHLCSVAFIPTSVPLVRWWQAGVCTYSVSFQMARKPKELTFCWQLSPLMPSQNVIRLYVVSLGRFLRPRENSTRGSLCWKVSLLYILICYTGI